MGIDYEGQPPGPGALAAVVVDRPPANAGFIGSFFMLGFPSTSPINDLLIPGVEMWLVTSMSVVVTQFPTTWQTARFELSGPGGMAGSFSFSVQAVWAYATPLIIGGTAFNFAASPALFF